MQTAGMEVPGDSEYSTRTNSHEAPEEPSAHGILNWPPTAKSWWSHPGATVPCPRNAYKSHSCCSGYSCDPARLPGTLQEGSPILVACLSIHWVPLFKSQLWFSWPHHQQRRLMWQDSCTVNTRDPGFRRRGCPPCSHSILTMLTWPGFFLSFSQCMI